MAKEDVKVYQENFLDALAETREVTSVEMQSFISRLPAAEMLSVGDVATALSVANATIYALIESGELRALNLGSRQKPYYRVFRVSVLRYIKTHII